MKKTLIKIIFFSIGFSIVYFLCSCNQEAEHRKNNPDAYYDYDDGNDCIDTVGCNCDYCSYIID